MPFVYMVFSRDADIVFYGWCMLNNMFSIFVALMFRNIIIIVPYTLCYTWLRNYSLLRQTRVWQRKGADHTSTPPRQVVTASPQMPHRSIMDQTTFHSSS